MSKEFDWKEFDHSFQAANDEVDFAFLAEELMVTTNKQNYDSFINDPFWNNLEKQITTAVIGLIAVEFEPQERSIALIACLFEYEGTSSVSVLDQLFENLAQDCPQNFAVRQYAKAKRGCPTGTFSSALCALRQRLRIFHPMHDARCVVTRYVESVIGAEVQ
ncbi:MAG: hypothetical protein RR186_04795 [Raoultibacter sp.]